MMHMMCAIFHMLLCLSILTFNLCSTLSAKLERVFFGGKVDGDLPGVFISAGYYHGENYNRMKSLLDSIAAGYRCGVLNNNVHIYGLSCPGSTDHQNVDCETCQSICKSFPLDSVVRFECRGSSRQQIVSGRISHNMDVCLQRDQIDSIVEGRAGGRELLRSNIRLLYLIGKGSRSELSSDDGKRLCIVKYTQEELNEISRVIRYCELDMNKLSTVLYDAIMRSFATYEKDSIVTTLSRYCYLAHESFHFLKDDIGLPLEESDFYKSAGDLIQFLPVIRHYRLLFEDEVMLFRYLVENVGESIIDNILDFGFIDDYRNNMTLGKTRFEAAQLINIIIEEGTNHHKMRLVKSGACQILSKVVEFPPNENAAEVAIQMLYHYFISPKEKMEPLPEDTLGTIPFVKSLSSSSVVISKLAVKSLYELGIGYNSYYYKMLSNGILLPLLQLMIKRPRIGILKSAARLLDELSPMIERLPYCIMLYAKETLNALSQLLLVEEDTILKSVCLAARYILKVIEFGQKKRVDLLEKKLLWYVFDCKREETKVVRDTRNSLKKQLKEMKSQVKQSGSVNKQLEGIRIKYAEADATYTRLKEILTALLINAEENAPKEVWQERLGQDDLPDSLEGVADAIVVAKENIDSITEARKLMKNCDELRKGGIGVVVAHLEGFE